MCLTAANKPLAALRGTISVVHMTEKPSLLRPTVSPVYWVIAAGAGRAYDKEPSQQLCRSFFVVLCTMSAAVRSETNFAVLALAVFSVCHGLHVRKAANIRMADINKLG